MFNPPPRIPFVPHVLAHPDSERTDSREISGGP